MEIKFFFRFCFKNKDPVLYLLIEKVHYIERNNFKIFAEISLELFYKRRLRRNLCSLLYLIISRASKKFLTISYVKFYEIL